MHARECLGRGKGLVDLDILRGPSRAMKRLLPFWGTANGSYRRE